MSEISLCPSFSEREIASLWKREVRRDLNSGS
jgi:hypothetical protein